MSYSSIVSPLLVLLFIFSKFASSDSNSAVTKAEIQSCSGCQLNSLPQVKKFIFEDVPKYENVVFKHIQGAPPELVLFTDTYEEVERISLKRLSREECNSLLKEHGFNLKEEITEKKEL